MKATFENNFHGTSIQIKMQADGSIKAADIDNACQKLCGKKDCSCDSILINNYQVVDKYGDLHWITE